MTAMTCTELSDVAAEFALGSLTGVDRARALGHLDDCEACGRLVAELSLVADRFVELAPDAEPPLGFESRVLARAAPVPSRRRTWIPAAAAAAVVAAAGAWLIGDVTRSAPPPATAASLVRADLIAAGRPVGTVFAYRAAPAWVYMTVDGGHATGPVTCELIRTDGTTVRIGSFRLNGGYGYWGAPMRADAGSFTGARLVASDGTVLAKATFPRSN